MSASDDVLDALDLAQLERLRDTYEARHDSASASNVRAAINRKGAVQTEELSNCGKLFPARVELDPSGLGTRPAIAYRGDCLAWMTPFMSPGRVGRIVVPEPREVTTRLQPGERVQIVKDTP